MSRFKLLRKVSQQCLNARSKSDCFVSKNKGLVLGAYQCDDASEMKLTESADKFDRCANGKLRELLKGSHIQRRKAQVFGGVTDDFAYIAVAGLGDEGATYDPVEALDMCKENIREAAGAGAKALQDMSVNHIYVEGFTNTEAAAEGSQLAVWRYTDWKSGEDKLQIPKVELYDSEDHQYWMKGTISTEAQNMARWVAECPSNLMTPSLFTQLAVEYLCPCGIEVDVKDRDWMEANRFTAFLTMARGSCQAPSLIEVRYCGGKQNERPVILLGKGSTYDSGGLALADCKTLPSRRADCGGAAATMAVIKAAARLALPVNITGVLALYENMPSGLALKPGDVVQSRNGKTIRIDNPENDGRVICSDCLAYCERYRPAFINVLATSYSGLMSSLGTGPSGIFSTSDVCWEIMNRAGSYTGDRVWRLPLFKCFRSRVTNFTGVDVVNTGLGQGGGSCLAAAFLMEFCPVTSDMMIVDMSATATPHKGSGMGYIRRGTMSGRPVRTVIQFLYNLVCPNDIKDDC